MRSLSLRTRLLIGVVAIALIQLLASVTTVAMTSDQLLDQIDERLSTAALVGADLTDGPNERIGDVYQGLVSGNGSLTTLNPVFERGDVVPAPEITIASIDAAEGLPFTVEAQRGQYEYRVMALATADGATPVVASVLDYEWTLNRVKLFVYAGTSLVMVSLALVAWWVLRLGITPMKRMTSAAEAIAAGDLSHRIDPQQPDTEAGQLGDALNAMLRRIETAFDKRTQSEARLRQFLADASHELRTPVATIRGYAELHQMGGLDDRAELDDAMRRTREESERMSRLIADMLSLANLDRNPVLQAEPVDLVAIASDSVQDAIARNDDRHVRTDLPTTALIVQGDEDLLRQALNNLVSNALVHTDANAVVSVVVSGHSQGAQVVVRDDGEGMSEAVLQRATERFFRADQSRSRDRGGSGLGLAIVKSIVDAHRGDIEIESEPGRGTTVTISLPAKSAIDSR